MHDIQWDLIGIKNMQYKWTGFVTKKYGFGIDHCHPHSSLVISAFIRFAIDNITETGGQELENQEVKWGKIQMRMMRKIRKMRELRVIKQTLLDQVVITAKENIYNDDDDDDDGDEYHKVIAVFNVRN